MSGKRSGLLRRVLRRDLLLSAGLSACVGSPLDLGHDDASLTLPANSTIVLPQNGSTNVTIVANLPPGETLRAPPVVTVNDSLSGVTAEPATVDGGSISFELSVTQPQMAMPAAGPYPTAFAVSVESSGGSLSKSFPAVVAVEANVGASVAANLGVGGRLQEYVGTSFQPADWQSRFFDAGTSGPGYFQQLAPGHVLIQLMNGGAIPLVSWNGSKADWDFHELDAIVGPVLESGAEVELQIAVVPPVIQEMQLPAGETESDLFAQYCQDLVSYYNGAGFVWGDAGVIQPPSDGGTHHPIQWWGIFSDFNTNGSDFNTNGMDMTPSQYASVYTTAVRAMKEVDSNIKFSAFEFSDFFSSSSGNPLDSWLQDSIGPILEAGAPVDAVSLHMFATSDRTTPDKDLFEAVEGSGSGRTMAGDLAAVRAWVDPADAGPEAGTIPVWVTENNVNSDYPTDAGYSFNNANQLFVDDPRGTNAFFAAWRPFIFAELGKAGNQGLVHWQFTAGRCPPLATYCAAPGPDSGIDAAALDTDVQNAEVDYTSGQPYLSYWVDYWLARMFTPPAGSPGPEILDVASTDTNVPPSVDVLATENGDGSVVVMAIDLDPTDSVDGGSVVDGQGVARTLVVDFSGLLKGTGVSSYQAETLLLDGTTLGSSSDASALEPSSGGSAPAPQPAVLPEPVTAANPRVTLTFSGYGVQFLKLLPEGDAGADAGADAEAAP